MDFETLFRMGMDRNLPKLAVPIHPNASIHIELGASGRKRNAERCFGLPDWQWPRDKIPYNDGTVEMVHAYHFIEHLTGEDAIAMLKEIQRVLKPGGIFQFCIPYAGSEISYDDLTHKSFWNENSFRMLMNNPYYDPSADTFKWKLRQHYLVIAGVVNRNLSMFGQLIREAD